MPDQSMSHTGQGTEAVQGQGPEIYVCDSTALLQVLPPWTAPVARHQLSTSHLAHVLHNIMLHRSFSHCIPE
jgi:hypothetical protein